MIIAKRFAVRLLFVFIAAAAMNRQILRGNAKTETIASAPVGIVCRIRSISPWNSFGEYKKADYERLIQVAKQIRTYKSDDIFFALTIFSQENLHGYGNYDLENSKALLLFRTLFVYPRRKSVSAAFPFFGVMWFSTTQWSAGSLDSSWPLLWNNDVPTISEPFGGTEGRGYNAATEYDFDRRHLPFRDLSETMKRIVDSKRS